MGSAPVRMIPLVAKVDQKRLTNELRACWALTEGTGDFWLADGAALWLTEAGSRVDGAEAEGEAGTGRADPEATEANLA